jgi:hypothetical protein
MKLLSIIITLVLAIFLLESQLLNDQTGRKFAIHRVCIDGYEYVITKSYHTSAAIIVQSLVSGTAGIPSPKKCGQKDKK